MERKDQSTLEVEFKASASPSESPEQKSPQPPQPERSTICVFVLKAESLWLLFKKSAELGIVVHTWDPRRWEAEAGGLLQI